MEKERKERFDRVAERRTRNAIDCIRLIGNCANKHNYSYTDKQVMKIIRALKQEVHDLQNTFNANQTKEDFKL